MRDKYNLGTVLIDVTFFKDESSHIYWNSTNFGITGEYVTSFENIDYIDTQYFSLDDLKEYSNRYL